MLATELPPIAGQSGATPKRRGSNSAGNIDNMNMGAIASARATFEKMRLEHKKVHDSNYYRNKYALTESVQTKDANDVLADLSSKRPSITKAMERLGTNHVEPKSPKPDRPRRGITFPKPKWGSGDNGVVKRFLKKTPSFRFRKKKKAFKAENQHLEFSAPTKPNVKYPPFILSCNDPKRVGWDLGIMVLLIYIAVVTPIRIGFDQEAGKENDPFFYYLEKVIDVVFIMDIFLNFCTSYFNEDDKEIIDRRKMAIQYLQTWFFLDFISSIPFDWIMENDASMQDLGNIQAAKTAKVAKAGRAGKIIKITRVLKLTKLLRLAKGSKIWWKYMDHFHFSRIQLKLGQLFILTLLISHISACLFALVAKLNSFVDENANDYRDSWLATSGLIDSPWEHQYVTAFYFVVATVTTVGYGDVSPQTTLEKGTVSLLMMFGGAFYGFIIASLASLLASWDINKTKLEAKMDSITNYMKVRKFPSHLYRKVRAYYRHYYAKKTALDEQAILVELSTQLKRKVVDFMVSDLKGQILQQVPMFKNLDRTYLAVLLSILKPLTAMNGEYIVREGERGSEMYILMVGHLEVRTDASEGSLADLRPGACFGELACLGLKPVRSASVVAIEYSELYSLSKEAIYDVFQNDFSIIEEMISTAAEGILQATQSSESPGKKGHRRKSGIIAKKVSEGKQKKQRTMSTSYAQHMQIRRGSLMPPDLSMLDDINETEDGESSKETGTEEVGRKADPDTPNAGASTGVKHTIGDAVLAGEVLSDKTKLNVLQEEVRSMKAEMKKNFEALNSSLQLVLQSLKK